MRSLKLIVLAIVLVSSFFVSDAVAVFYPDNLYSTIRENYYRQPVKINGMMEINEFLRTLDPYSRFISVEEVLGPVDVKAFQGDELSVLPKDVDYILNNEVGVIKIRGMNRDAEVVFAEVARDLASRGAKGIVIDFRGCGGGLVEMVSFMSGFWFDEKVVIGQLKYGDGTVGKVYSITTSNPYFKNMPTAVLVDGGTVSAAEMFAVAMQENKKAIVVGSKTYGKGTSQTLFQFGDSSILRLTTAEWLTPTGVKVDGIGITPDVEAKGGAELEEALRQLFK